MSAPKSWRYCTSLGEDVRPEAATIKEGFAGALLFVAMLSRPVAEAHHTPGDLKVAAILSLPGPNTYLGQAGIKGL